MLALLSFTHGRDIRRLRDWAGSAPERDAERKEATSAVAAQRAEELRALEEGRTAERDALDEREERRRRREAGLPETSRGERARERFSGLGDRLAEPRYLIALFVVVLVIVGGVGYALLSGSGGDASGQNGKRNAAATIKPSEIEVAVLNGTSVPDLAASFGERVEDKGFRVGAVTNTDSAYDESVVMFTPGHKPEARKVAKFLAIDGVREMNGEVVEVAEAANVAVVVGEDNAAAAG